MAYHATTYEWYPGLACVYIGHPPESIIAASGNNIDEPLGPSRRSTRHVQTN